MDDISTLKTFLSKNQISVDFDLYKYGKKKLSPEQWSAIFKDNVLTNYEKHSSLGLY